MRISAGDFNLRGFAYDCNIGYKERKKQNQITTLRAIFWRIIFGENLIHLKI